MKSLQSKFLTIIVSGLFVMMLVVALIGLLTTNKILHDNADEMLDTKCQMEAQSIDGVLSGIKSSVKIIEKKTTSELMSASDLKDPDYLKSFSKMMRASFENVAENTNGVCAYYLRFEPSLTNPTAGFFVSLDDVGRFTDREPTPITDDPLRVEDVQHTKWFYEPYKAGKALWMAPYYHARTDDLMISYVAPIYKGESFIGVAGMDIYFSSLTSVVDEIEVFDNGYAYLTYADGNTVYLPEKNSAPTLESDRIESTDSSYPLQNGMTLTVVASYADIQKDSYPLLNNIMLAFVIVLAVFIAVTILVTHRITAPLKELTEAAENFSSGKARFILKKKSNDEIGKLARVLDETSGRLEEYMSYINALAYRDSLTGVKNSTAYKEFTSTLDKKMQSSSVRFAVVVCDINGLKQTNDSFGHEAGNELIRIAIKRVCDEFTHSPVFRIGGDEFVAVLENADYDNRYEHLAHLEYTSTDDRFIFGGQTVRLSLSAGLADYDPAEDKCFDDVFVKADSAMYQRKQKIKEGLE